MKTRSILLTILLALILAAPLSLADEARHQVILKDGSVLRGQVLSMDDDALVMATDYTEALKIPRDQVARIVLAGSDGPATPAGDPNAGMPEVVAKPTGRGTLEIALKGDAVRSSTRFKKRGDRERAAQMNTIHFKVFMDGELIYHDQDDTIEKEIRERGWVFMRNKHHFPPAVIDMPAGKHTILVVISNELHLLKQGEKQSGVVASELAVEDLVVRKDGHTRVAIEGKTGRFAFGKYEMTLLSRQ